MCFSPLLAESFLIETASQSASALHREACVWPTTAPLSLLDAVLLPLLPVVSSTAGLHWLAMLLSNTQAQHVGWASFLPLSSPLPVTCHPGINTSQLCKACLSHQLSGLIRLPSLQPDTLASDKAISVFVGGLCLGTRPPPSFARWRCDKTGSHVDLNQWLCIFLKSVLATGWAKFEM